MTLILEGVTKRFVTGTAVDDVSFSVERGAVFGLLGPNGAGKTTTIRMVLDILRPDAGRLEWAGAPMAGLSRTEIGYLPEERGLYPDMPVGEQIAFFGEISGLERAESRRRATRWMERLQLEEHADKPVSALSKGNQQKVQLLVTIAHEPPLLVLDEPFSGLDPVNHALMEEVIAELRAAGSTLVLSTHDMEQVESLCDAVAMLDHGRLVFAGDVATLHARHDDARRLRLRFTGDEDGLCRALPGLERGAGEGGWTTFTLPGDQPAESVLRVAMDHGDVSEVRDERPTMRDIFLAEIGSPA